jgi:putative spermidine/putrescine transport system substrate-binding protein
MIARSGDFGISQGGPVTYRWKPYAIAASVAAALVNAGCDEKKEGQAAAPAAPGEQTAAIETPEANPMAALIEAAKREGQLTTIALPHSWCNYGAVIQSFKDKYGLQVNELDPHAGSGEEIEAVRASKDNKSGEAPDVIDVGLSFGPSAKAEGLLQPYKVATWNSIPDSAKDPEGHWYGDFYGVLAFQVNSDIVKTLPQDWSDLLKEEYKNAVALAGDPRSSNQAIQAVYAAGLSQSGGGAAKAGEAGLRFFADLNKAGNFVPLVGNAETLEKGSTPIVIRWDYNALADRDQFKGKPKIEVVIPKNGVIAGVYAQAISAHAAHPNAAKLWMEHLYSDEGQLTWLKGYCHPIRFNDLLKNGKVPQELLDKLPPAAAYEAAVFPTVDEQAASKDVITTQWEPVVGANVQ